MPFVSWFGQWDLNIPGKGDNEIFLFVGELKGLLNLSNKDGLHTSLKANELTLLLENDGVGSHCNDLHVPC